MQLNRALVFLCLVIAVGAQREHRVTCYLDVLTPHTREGPCTHVIVPSAWTDDAFNFQNLSEDDYDALEKIKGRNPSLKILLGLEVKASRLKLMFTSESSVENLIHNLSSYLREKRFDGLDVTWDNGPISDESSNSTELLTNFLKSLRGAFEETPDSDRILLLSSSLSHQYDHSSAVGCDVRTLLQYVDFISLPPAHLEKDGLYINKTVQHWQDQQVDLQKLNLALPAFLRRSQRRHHHHHHHHHHHSNNDKDTEEPKKYQIHGMGLNLANQVCQAIKSREEFITLTSLSNEQSLVEEVSWLLQKGFGGVGVVFIDTDVFFNSVCDSIAQDERAIVESKMIMYHGRRVHGHGGHHHHHGQERHHSHRDHHQQPNLSHRSHDIGHHHHRHRHHHRHEHHGHHRHGHHHHHPSRPTPQYVASTERQLGLE